MMGGSGPLALPRRAVLGSPLLLTLRVSGVGSLLELTACPAPAPPVVVVPGTATGIDVHAHVFNARDLPIPGFVLHVVLEEDPLAPAQVGPLVTFIALLLDQAARTPDQEIAALEQGTEHGFAVAAAAPFGGTLFENARQAALAMQQPDARSQEVIRRVQALSPRVAPGSIGAAAAPLPPRAFLTELSLLTPGGPLPVQGAGGGAAVGAAGIETPDQVAVAAANGVVHHASNQSGVFYLAGLVTRPRNELVRRLIGLPGAGERSGIALVTPALIDFSYWLDDRAGIAECGDVTSAPRDVEPLGDQIRVMSRIATLSAGGGQSVAVHPFVSFCPWRQIAEQAGGVALAQQQWTLVRDAIFRQGFIGVKLYPVMGFLPIGNADADPGGYPTRLRCLTDWAARMDAALAELYDWCVDNDVPVMAHCSYSQYPSAAAGRRGSPAAWRPALERWPTLRLNLAHCGGVWDLAPKRARRIGEAQHAGSLWPLEVLALLDDPRFTNLYADLADFGDVIGWRGPAPGGTGCDAGPPGPEDDAVTPLARAVACHPGARQRLMYGTDYMFLIQTPNTQEYLAGMRDRLAPTLGIQAADFMGWNAARFLGLTHPDSKTRRRLDAFRGDAFLARWNAA